MVAVYGIGSPTLYITNILSITTVNYELLLILMMFNANIGTILDPQDHYYY